MNSQREHRPGDADRVLLEAVEETAYQDQRDDLLVRACHAYPAQRRLKLSNDRR